MKDIKATGGKQFVCDATLTSKVKSRYPKEIRDSLHMKQGDRIESTLLPDGTVLMRVKNESVLDLAGTLQREGQKAVPVEDLSR